MPTFWNIGIKNAFKPSFYFYVNYIKIKIYITHTLKNNFNIEQIFKSKIKHGSAKAKTIYLIFCFLNCVWYNTTCLFLSLSGKAIHVHIQSSMEVSLMSLKRLLISISNAEVSSVNALLRGCPIIETLDLCFSPDDLDTVCIPPSIKWLKITIENNNVGACLEINVPDLDYLDITGITFGHVFSMYNLPNVVEAYLDVFPQLLGSIIPLHNLLDALSKIKKLGLRHSTTKVMFYSMFMSSFIAN